MQDSQAVRELAGWCAAGPGLEKCGSPLEDLMGGDGFGDLDQKAGKGGAEAGTGPTV